MSKKELKNGRKRDRKMELPKTLGIKKKKVGEGWHEKTVGRETMSSI